MRPSTPIMVLPSRKDQQQQQADSNAERRNEGHLEERGQRCTCDPGEDARPLAFEKRVFEVPVVVEAPDAVGNRDDERS